MNRLLLLPLLGAVACVPPYKPPRADQPHAVVKLRRSYDTVAGTNLSEAVEIDEHSALSASAASRAVNGARTDAILVHPVPSTFAFHGGFFHTETRLVYESYQVPHTTYGMESYSCGSGSSYRSCTRSVSRTTYETRYRNVLRQVQVSDGACSRALRFAPRDGRVYLLQYTYHDQSVCSLSCFEQVPQEGGTFQNLQCPAAPPEAN